MGIPCSAGAGHAITEGCEDAPFPLAGRSTPPSPCGNPTFSTADPPPSSNDHKTTATTTTKKTAWERQEPRRQNPETRQGCGTPQIPREVAGAKNETPSPPQKMAGKPRGGLQEGQVRDRKSCLSQPSHSSRGAARGPRPPSPAAGHCSLQPPAPLAVPTQPARRHRAASGRVPLTPRRPQAMVTLPCRTARGEAGRGPPATATRRGEGAPGGVGGQRRRKRGRPGR